METQDFSHLLNHEETEASPPPTISAQVERMRALRDELDRLEALRKTTQAEYDELRKRALIDAFQAADVRQVRLTSGELAFIRTDVYAHVIEEDRPRFFQWLRDNGHGSLIVPQVHPSTLKAFVKEQRDNGGSLPDYVRIAEEPTIALRAPAKKKV